MREMRRLMNPHPGKWYGISLGMHLITMFLLALLSSNLAQTTEPVIIDLSLDPGSAVKDEEAEAVRQPRSPGRVTTPPLPRPDMPIESRQAAADVPSPSPGPAPASAAPVSGQRDSLLLQVQRERVTKTTEGGGTDNAAGPAQKVTREQTASSSGETTPEKAKYRYLREHFTYIRDLVMKGLVYPNQARKMGWSGKVTVSFVVCEDGSAREIKVLQSSGHQMLDRCAIERVRTVAPFPKPPVQAEIVIPVLFKLM